MSPQDPQAAALLAHVVSQVEENVQFLASQNYISQADASAILTKLPNSNRGVSQITNGVARMPVASRAVPVVPGVKQAKALWPYNENGQDAEDLSFSAGDIIEIVEETNEDWWVGRFNGKQALFPSNYVERIEPATAVSVAAGSAKKPYKPFGAALHGSDVPPPAGQGVNSLGLQEKQGTEEKKNRFGQYKNTVAHSAAGGVGFGAGAAIGGGLVRAIF